MVGIAVVTRAALLIARRASTWTIDEHMRGRSPECVAVDLRRPTQVHCGTASAGLFQSRDSGRNWELVGPGIYHPIVTAVDVGHTEEADGYGVVYAGTEPEAHDMAVRRMVAAGAQPITWLGLARELQRDWARTERLGEVAQLFVDHAGASGSVSLWETQLLGAPRNGA